MPRLIAIISISEIGPTISKCTGQAFSFDLKKRGNHSREAGSWFRWVYYVKDS